MPTIKPEVRQASNSPEQPVQDTVQVATYAQDPWVGSPVTSQFERSKIGDQMANSRIQVTDTRPKMKPDDKGNFLPPPGSDGDSQINAFVTTNRTLAMWEGYVGGQVKWSFGSPLRVTPHKKEGMNAYYSRWDQGTNYFFQRSKELDTTIKTAQSLDIVSHETGHAMLDGMKPGYLGSSDRETGAFHEAFGDCIALLMTLQDPLMNEKVIAETGGDLRQQNVAGHLAEQFGIARKRTNADPNDDNNAWLRNSINNFTYVPPESLGDGGGNDTTLGGEIHSFGRLWAGAFYDCIDAAYQYGMKSENLPPAQALKFAADTVGPLLARAVDRAPANRGRYKDMALQMIKADSDTNSGKLGEAFTKIFSDRKIISGSDIASEQERLRSLPNIAVDHNFTSPEEAASFIKQRADKLGLPADQDYHTITVRINENGEQVVSMLFTETHPIQGVAGLEGLETDINGGVTACFDAKGRLSDFHYNPVCECLESEMDGIRYWSKSDRIAPPSREGDGLQGTRDDGQVYQAVVEGNKLVRIPVSSCNCGDCHRCKSAPN